MKSAETRPRSWLSEVTVDKAGASTGDESSDVLVVVGRGGESERKAGSKMSPARKGTGKDSGVLWKSLWPSVQYSTAQVSFRTSENDIAERTLAWNDICRDYVRYRISIHGCHPYVISD